jgi:anti-anti-sigma factor
MKCSSERVKLEERGTVVIVAFADDILDDAEDLRRVIRPAFKNGARRIVFDMSGARYVSARVLGVIAGSVHRMRRRRGEVKVVCPDAMLRRLLEVTGFCNAIDVVTSEDDALNGFPDGIETPEKLMLWKEPEVCARA